MIHVKRHELEAMFHRHYSLYRSGDPRFNNSHKLLLFYAVECGLKALILERIHKSTTQGLLEHAKLGCLTGKNGHNIKEMLKFLNVGQFHFPDLRCKNGGLASASEYNQVWRYGAETVMEEESKIVSELVKLAEWIKGGL